MIIFVVGMIVLGIVVYQFVLKKCKDDDMPPQRAGIFIILLGGCLQLWLRLQLTNYIITTIVLLSMFLMLPS